MSSAFLPLGMRRRFELPYDYKHTIPIRKDRAKKRKEELQSHHSTFVTAIGRLLKESLRHDADTTLQCLGIVYTSNVIPVTAPLQQILEGLSAAAKLLL